MKKKVERISHRLCSVIAEWEGVEAVLLGESAGIGVLDPYFRIQHDVYYRGVLPAAGVRRERLGDPLTFETARAYPGDHFLSEELPVLIGYHEINRFDRILERIGEGLWVPHEAGTSQFYRLCSGTVLHNRSPWLEAVRDRLNRLPDTFWELLLDAGRFSLTRSLSDLGAAVFRSDPLFYLVSASGFARSVYGFLFALNRRFEPPGRQISEQVLSLPNLPDGFHGRFESFLRHEAGLPPERKREVAELLARSILALH